MIADSLLELINSSRFLSDGSTQGPPRAVFTDSNPESVLSIAVPAR